MEPSNINIKDPMLVHVLNTSIKLNPTKIFVIVGKYKNIIEETINKYIKTDNLIEYVIQEPALGTAHAIKCSLPQISKFIDEKAIILSGDVPLISIDTLRGLDGETNKLLITELENPYGCGRILFDNTNKIIGIREEKDCNDEERKINFVNCGIYQIAVKDLVDLIPLIGNENKSSEYYLTDIIYLMIQKSIPIDTHQLEKYSQWEIKNVNTKKDLEYLNEYIEKMNIV